MTSFGYLLSSIFISICRIIMPMTVQEYQIGQLYAVITASKRETGGGEGVQVLENQPFENTLLFGPYDHGQYTHKKLFIKSKVAGWLQKLFPPEAFILDEKAWNAFPYCKTVVTNPDYMKEKFYVKIESLHVDNDRGETDNIFNLPPETLKLREVVDVDITVHPGSEKDYKLELDPQKFKSLKTGRGPLGDKWHRNFVPVMCCYKLVTLEFKWIGFQLLAEKFMHNNYPKVFGLFNREVFCLIDEWIGLKMDDIRRLEEDAKKQLDADYLKLLVFIHPAALPVTSINKFSSEIRSVADYLTMVELEQHELKKRLNLSWLDKLRSQVHQFSMIQLILELTKRAFIPFQRTVDGTKAYRIM